MDETRARVLSLLEETGISQAELARRISAEGLYRVQPSELSASVNGSLTTPKANRVVADCYSILDEERRRANLAKHDVPRG